MKRPAGQTQLASDAEVFDLREASARLWPFTKRTRNIGVLVGTGAVLIALVVLLVSIPLIFRSEMSGFNWFVLGVFGFVAAVGAAMAVSDSHRRVPGANEIRVSNLGVTLSYPDGREVSRAWIDPGLEIMLYDFSRSASKSYRTPDYPYMLRDNGIDSLLTEGAYHALRDRAERCALLEGPGSGTSWNYPRDATPVTYRIVARARAPQVPSQR